MYTTSSTVTECAKQKTDKKKKNDGCGMAWPPCRRPRLVVLSFTALHCVLWYGYLYVVLLRTYKTLTYITVCIQVCIKNIIKCMNVCMSFLPTKGHCNVCFMKKDKCNCISNEVIKIELI